MLNRFIQELSPKQKDFLKRVASIILFNCRQSRTYRQWLRFLDESEYWPLEKIQQWQLQQVKRIVEYAYNNTEGYKQLYREANANPADIRTLEDIERLPFVTKELLRDNIELFSVKSKSRIYSTTGGSTGIPFGFYSAIKNICIENAFMHKGWSCIGWKPGLVTAVLRGGFVGTANKPFKYDVYHRELSLSSYHLTEKTIDIYLSAIEKYRPKVLAVYPSSMNMLCDILKDKEIKSPSCDFMLLGSENVYEGHIEKFRETFPDTKIFAWYGQSERVVLAPWCEHSENYHVWPFYGYTEILGETNERIKTGAEGEIVGTSFHNHITPFIRYRTMDTAVKGENFCPSCKRSFVILNKILGRRHEVIVTSTGRYISMTAINMHDSIFDNLKQFQFFQQEKGRVVFKYIPKTSFSCGDITVIESGLMKKFGGDVELTLKEVMEIPRTKAGKYKWLEQKIPIKYGK